MLHSCLQARTACGRWLNVVRNCCRMTLSWALPGEKALVSEVVRWVGVLPTATYAYLRPQDGLWRYAADDLSPSELAWLQSCGNPSVAVLQVLSGLLARCGVQFTIRCSLSLCRCSLRCSTSPHLCPTTLPGLQVWHECVPESHHRSRAGSP